jgi:hypothetical protein
MTANGVLLEERGGTSPPGPRIQPRTVDLDLFALRGPQGLQYVRCLLAHGDFWRQTLFLPNPRDPRLPANQMPVSGMSQVPGMCLP